MPNLSSIAADQIVEYSEDVIVDGAIGNNAHITVNNAKIEIRGAIGDGVKIFTVNSMPPQQNVVQLGGATLFSVQSAPVNTDITVLGNVGQNVNILCAGNAAIRGDVGQNTTIKAKRNINIDGDVAAAARITTVNGVITVRGTLGANAEASTINGNVSVGSAAATAICSSLNGRAYINGVRQAPSARPNSEDAIKAVVNEALSWAPISLTLPIGRGPRLVQSGGDINGLLVPTVESIKFGEDGNFMVSSGGMNLFSSSSTSHAFKTSSSAAASAPASKSAPSQGRR